VDKHHLTPLFAPRSVVVFAGDPALAPDDVSRTVVGRQLLQALASARFEGEVTWLDSQVKGSLGDLAQARADLAIIALPSERIADALEVAGRIRARAALVLSSGVGTQQAKQLQAIARRHGMALLGPNSLGFQRPALGLNACVAGPMSAPGPLALVSQSGALTASILDWAAGAGVNFSHVVSLGPNTQVDLPQVLDFLAGDQATHSILVYMEGIHHARRFMSALRAAAHAKPVVVMKAGRRAAGTQAALTHSSAIVGSDEVFDAALRRAGAVRVRAFTQLFSAAKCLAARYRPVGRRLAVVTNGGGPGVIAADWIDEIGLELGVLEEALRPALAKALSPQASLDDLIDLGEEADATAFGVALDAALKDRGIDGVLVVYSPKPGGDAQAVARAVAARAGKTGKPLLACWMGDDHVRQARDILGAAGIPHFRSPDGAADAFGNIASFYQNQQLLQQTPPPRSTHALPDLEGARLLIEGVLTERRQVLTEMESKALLAAFHIPVTRTMLARNANEAMLIASQLGYPVALKIDSADIGHKSDVQGVALNVSSAAQVRDIFEAMMARVRRLEPTARLNGVTIQPMAVKNRGREVFVGLTTDMPFGPVITFGAGGTMVELIADRAMELPPLNQFLARRLIDRARVAEMLGAWRGAKPADVAAVEQILLRVSEMVCELPQLRQMDINPVIVDETGAVAVDARIVIDHAPPTAHDYHHLAILPYPATHESEWPMKGGGLYTIRPIRPDDAQMLQAFVRGLSQESRYFRFASTLKELPPRMLARYTLIDYDREMALVAVMRPAQTEAEQGAASDGGEALPAERIIGVSRYVTNPDQSSCEFSLVVGDDFKGQGLGSRLMLAIADFARSKGLEQIEGLVLANNAAMLRLMHRLGYEQRDFPEDRDFKLVVKPLQSC
jgi:acetyltransferase